MLLLELEPLLFRSILLSVISLRLEPDPPERMVRSWVSPEIEESEVVMLRLTAAERLKVPAVVILPAVEALAMLMLIVSPDPIVVLPETVWVADPRSIVEPLPPTKLPVMALALLPKFKVPVSMLTLPVMLPPIFRVAPVVKLTLFAKIVLELVAASKVAPLATLTAESALVAPILPLVVDEAV